MNVSNELNSNSQYQVEHNNWYQVWEYQVRVVARYPLVPVKRGDRVPTRTWYEGLPGTLPQVPSKSGDWVGVEGVPK